MAWYILVLTAWTGQDIFAADTSSMALIPLPEQPAPNANSAFPSFLFPIPERTGGTTGSPRELIPVEQAALPEALPAPVPTYRPTPRVTPAPTGPVFQVVTDEPPPVLPILMEQEEAVAPPPRLVLPPPILPAERAPSPTYTNLPPAIPPAAGAPTQGRVLVGRLVAEPAAVPVQAPATSFLAGEQEVSQPPAKSRPWWRRLVPFR